MTTINIPENATNGDVIMMLFPDTIARERVDGYDGVDLEVLISKEKHDTRIFKCWCPTQWWGQKYKRGEKKVKITIEALDKFGTTNKK